MTLLQCSGHALAPSVCTAKGTPGGSAYQDSEMGEEGDTLFVWGTNLTINGITKRVRAFYKGFRANDDDAMPKYEEMLREVRSKPVFTAGTAALPAHRACEALHSHATRLHSVHPVK